MAEFFIGTFSLFIPCNIALLIVDNENNPWFIDANAVPGMTDTSLWPLAAEADLGFGKLIDAVTRDGAARGVRS